MIENYVHNTSAKCNFHNNKIWKMCPT